MATFEVSLLRSRQAKEPYIREILEEKKNRGLSFEQMAQALGYSNVYMVQLLLLQTRLPERQVEPLKVLLPGLRDEVMAEMRKVPWKCFDSDNIQDPAFYR